MEWLYNAAWLVPLTLVSVLGLAATIGYLALRQLSTTFEEIDAEVKGSGSDLDTLTDQHQHQHTLPTEPADIPESMWEEDYGGEG